MNEKIKNINITPTEKKNKTKLFINFYFLIINHIKILIR